MADQIDGGRCLMDEINALFAPPGRGDAKSRANAARQAELHPYFKRPGKKFCLFQNLKISYQLSYLPT